MTDQKLSMLRFLDKRRGDVSTAAEIMRAMCMEHCECYLALVELESAGLVRVFIGGHWKPSLNGRMGWELTDDGRRMTSQSFARSGGGSVNLVCSELEI